MKKISEKEIFAGNWLTFHTALFETMNGDQFDWEIIKRKGNKNVVACIPKMQPSGKLVLIKQFRPAVNNYILGFPAGIMDIDNIEKQALKELKEETGYKGEINSISPPLKINSASMDITFYLTQVTIDETLSENKNPLQNLEIEEDIDVVLIDPNHMKSELEALQKDGIMIGSAVWYFLSGMLWHSNT